jgi:glutathione S-transferase
LYTLYARENAGSAAVEALLALLDVPHKLVAVPKTPEAKAPDWYYTINPRGEVPTLLLSDGTVMTESAAMMIYLADAHPAAGLAPPACTAARTQYLRWMIFLSATIYPAALRFYYPDRHSINPGHADAIAAQAAQDMARDFSQFAAHMGDGPFILGAAISAVDVYAAMLLAWSDDLDQLFAQHLKLKNLYAATTTIPAVQKVWNRNGMP